MPIPILTDLTVARRTVLQRVRLDQDADTSQAVAAVVSAVQQRGDSALREFSSRFDGVVPADFAVPPELWAAAAEALPADLRAALELAVAEIRAFHQHQARSSWIDHQPEGARGQLIRPLERVGIYVPGGAAPLPSSLIHAAVPAQVAGVGSIVVCSPPQRQGGLPAPVVLAAAHIVGVDAVYAVGGAQAIAALAFGTESIPRVDKIAGPGNRYVIQAMRLVYGAVDITSLPGPTETLVIADAAADPRLVAADLLAQAEHVEASAILLTDSADLAAAVSRELERQLELLPATNARAAEAALLERGAVIVVPSLDVALQLSNEYGPEHLCLLVRDPWSLVGRVQNAGGIFLGEESFEVLGDYVAGPSHIMPTEGTARYASPVNVDDFRKVISLVALQRSALQRIGPAARRIAQAEGLFAHAAAVAARLDPPAADGV
jgi:histidinol dehydrogenase